MSKKRRSQGLLILSRIWLLAWILSALGAGIFSTHVPWVAKCNQELCFPAFQNITALLLNQELPPEWQNPNTLPNNLEILIPAPVPFSPNQLDLYGRADFDKHPLGTDILGRDVLSRILHGARTALLTGLIAMAFALSLGLTLGGIAGYFGDDKIQMTGGQILVLIPGLILAWFYGVQIPLQASAWHADPSIFTSLAPVCILIGTPIICLLLGRQLQYPAILKKRYALWLDFWVSRAIEIKQSIPGLFLIIAVSAFLEPSMVMIALLIGFTAWTPIARFVRAELLRIREENYIQAAEALGFSGIRIFVRHALPNALSPVWVLLSFGFAGAILAEASVSFIQDQGDAISWGGMLAAARNDPQAWWLAVWPGLTLFITLISLHINGEHFRDTR
jgi:peptide/nickel transport system permease protein